MFTWYRDITRTERVTFWTCLGGWALDALDVQMFSLAIPALVATWHVSNIEAGLVGGVTLVTSAMGGWLGGALSDRIGRLRALQVTVLWFALATFIAAFTQSFEQLLVTKAIQGFGFGAEWACGAVLMAEIIRPEHRGKALGAVQSGWAIGWGVAVLLYTAAFSFFPAEIAWRVMFAVGLLPALLILYIRRSVPEPARVAKAGPQPGFFATLFGVFAPETLRVTLIGGLFGLGAHGGFYGLFTWLPTYLKTERGLSVMGTGGYLAVIIVAFGLGCIVAGQLLDQLGRRLSVALFAVGCVVVTVAYLVLPISGAAMLLLGFPLGFCAAGIPASMGALFNELYPAGVRGTGVGFCCNFGRILAAGLPVLIGIPFAVASIAMIWWGRRSDRVHERVWHTALPLGLSALALASASFATTVAPFIVILCLILVGTYALKGPFFALSSEWLAGTAAAAGLAQINALDNLAGFVDSFLIGSIQGATGSYALELLPLVLIAAFGCVAVLLLGSGQPVRTSAATPSLH